ncbi:MAG: DUF3276 family protein [Bacteroidales bacterium]|nr:DUF3276 family protein [Bacteroidales bacterium]
MYSEDYERARAQERNTEDVYSKPVRAGKRTYFFDVKATKGNNDFYLTITESKRRQEQDGTFSYDKHKIFLYKEDFEKFAEGLDDAVAYIRARLQKDAPDGVGSRQPDGPSFSDVSFDEF